VSRSCTHPNNASVLAASLTTSRSNSDIIIYGSSGSLLSNIHSPTTPKFITESRVPVKVYSKPPVHTK
jgi:hypothetical protein